MIENSETQIKKLVVVFQVTVMVGFQIIFSLKIVWNNIFFYFFKFIFHIIIWKNLKNNLK
jgi:hypothetical protein